MIYKSHVVQICFENSVSFFQINFNVAILFAGVIKLSIGNSNSVEAALNFLYGQRPKITIDNAGDVFEMAEFLMIDELKALCIERMRAVPVNLGSCLKLLLLMSTYDFYLQKTSDFILAHLTELLVMEEMLLVNKDAVQYIITEPVLSYVSRDDCFRFLLKWTKHCSRRHLDFPELLSCLKDVSKDVLASVDLSCLTEDNILLCNNLSNVSSTPCDILVSFPPDSVSGKHKFNVYSFELNAWFQSLFQDNSYWSASSRSKLTNQNTFIKLSHDTKMVMYYNMEDKTLTEKRVEVAFCDERPELKHLNYINNKLYCVRSSTSYIEKLLKDPLEGFLAHQSGYRINDLFTLQDWEGIKIRERMEGCTVYFAEDADEDKITFKPLISMRGTTKAFCMLEEFVCLIMKDRKELLIYAVNECLTVSVNLTEHTTDEVNNIFPCHVGGLYAVTKASILQIDIQMKNNKIITKVVDTWKMKKTDDNESSNNSESNRFPPRFEIVEDKIFTIARCPEKYEYIYFYQILPKKIGFLDKAEKQEIVVPDRMKRERDVQFLQMLLPKDSVRCHIDCPHCKQTDQGRYQIYDRDDDSDEYAYYDDSDDVYVPAFYGYGGYDNDYYDSSDDSYVF